MMENRGDSSLEGGKGEKKAFGRIPAERGVFYLAPKREREVSFHTIKKRTTTKRKKEKRDCYENSFFVRASHIPNFQGKNRARHVQRKGGQCHHVLVEGRGGGGGARFEGCAQTQDSLGKKTD